MPHFVQIELLMIFEAETLIKFLLMFYRKEVKDPDVLYNMLKNLLAQIKVRLAC